MSHYTLLHIIAQPSGTRMKSYLYSNDARMSHTNRREDRGEKGGSRMKEN